MSKLFLIPIISVFDVHDAAVREWLDRLDENTILSHLEYPFKIERFFSEGGKHALVCADIVHKEVLSLMGSIDPQSVFLDISIDLYGLENKYNKRLISPHEFWEEYYEILSNRMPEPAKTLYGIYIKEVIDRNIGLIESKDRLPLSVVFYGLDMKSREELIPVYEELFSRDGEFTLKAARAINEIANLREKPKRLWYSPLKSRQMAISYEETERFYNEFLIRLKRLLKFKVRDYFVKTLKDEALLFVLSYEKFLDHKMKEDEIRLSNIIEGLNVLTDQSDDLAVVVLCEPMAYNALLNELKNEKSLKQMIAMEEAEIKPLLDKMKPFLQKYRIIESNYEIALDILGRKKPVKYEAPNTLLVPV